MQGGGGLGALVLLPPAVAITAAAVVFGPLTIHAACPPLPPPHPRSAYPEKKIQENVQCEIMHVVVEEATDSYR